MLLVVIAVAVVLCCAACVTMRVCKKSDSDVDESMDKEIADYDNKEAQPQALNEQGYHQLITSSLTNDVYEKYRSRSHAGRRAMRGSFVRNTRLLDDSCALCVDNFSVGVDVVNTPC